MLVAASDIWGGIEIEAAIEEVAELADGKPAVMVLDNHEHWDGEIENTIGRARAIAKGLWVTLLEGEAVTIAGVRFVGATLWSDYELASNRARSVNETGERFWVVPDGWDGAAGERRLLTVGDAIELHRGARARLTELIDAHTGPEPLIAVTHHAPHPVRLTPPMVGTWAAGNGASDLGDLVKNGRVALWVHGHIHESMDETLADGTGLLRNPAGPMWSNVEFNEALVIEV